MGDKIVYALIGAAIGFTPFAVSECNPKPPQKPELRYIDHNALRVDPKSVDVVYFALDRGSGYTLYGPAGAPARETMRVAIDSGEIGSPLWNNRCVAMIHRGDFYRIAMTPSDDYPLWSAPGPQPPVVPIISSWRKGYWRRVGSIIELQSDKRINAGAFHVLEWDQPPTKKAKKK